MANGVFHRSQYVSMVAMKHLEIGYQIERKLSVTPRNRPIFETMTIGPHMKTRIDCGFD